MHVNDERSGERYFKHGEKNCAHIQTRDEARSDHLDAAAVSLLSTSPSASLWKLSLAEKKGGMKTWSDAEQESRNDQRKGAVKMHVLRHISSTRDLGMLNTLQSAV